MLGHGVVYALEIAEDTDSAALDIKLRRHDHRHPAHDAGDIYFADVGAEYGFAKIEVDAAHHRDNTGMLRHAPRTLAPHR